MPVSPTSRIASVAWPWLADEAVVRRESATCVDRSGLGAKADSVIWDYAKVSGFIIVTKDSDFEERSVLLGAPPKIIWLRTGNCTTLHLVALLTKHAATIEKFDLSGDAILEIV